MTTTRLPERDKLREALKYPGRPESIPALLACTEFVLSALDAGDDGRWWLGTMNDGLFIIDKPPRTSTDEIWHERPNRPNPILNASALPDEHARQIVDAHNAALLAARIAPGTGYDAREIENVEADARALIELFNRHNANKILVHWDRAKEVSNTIEALLAERAELRDFKRRTEEAFQLTCAISQPEEIVGPPAARIASGAPTRSEIADIIIESLSPAPDGPDAGPWAAADRILVRIASGAGDGDPSMEAIAAGCYPLADDPRMASGPVPPAAHQGEPSEDEGLLSEIDARYHTQLGRLSAHDWAWTLERLRAALQGEPSEEQVRLAEMTYDSALWVAKVSREEAMRRALRTALRSSASGSKT